VYVDGEKEKVSILGLEWLNTNAPDWRTVWEDHGVTTLLGFNEPDKDHQSNL
jgi:hypothetical protein